jgi:hypothetical protein
MINQFEMQLTQKYVSQYRKSSKKEREKEEDQKQNI